VERAGFLLSASAAFFAVAYVGMRTVNFREDVLRAIGH
jgi:hypothetical protein